MIYKGSLIFSLSLHMLILYMGFMKKFNGTLEYYLNKYIRIIIQSFWKIIK